MKSSSDIIVIGCGIIGCSIAYRLAKDGLKVTVIERGRPGREASWAAAGMLTPQSEAAHSSNDAFSDLCLKSHRLYPDFVAELEEETGMSIGYRSTGSIFVAFDYVEAEALAGLAERERRAGRTAEELTPKQARELEPELSESIQAGIYLPEDSYVDNRALIKALVVAAERRGVQLFTDTPAIGFEYEGPRIRGVLLPGHTLAGDIVINAAGSWAGLIDQTGRIKLPVRPIRGQIVCLEQLPQRLSHLIHSSECYIVPWPDGRTLIGATVENAGYRKEVTAQGVRKLLNAAVRMIPSLDSATIRDAWAGLRPDTEDNLPILGFSHVPNLMIATGHFRNGILLAPITAELIAETIISGRASIQLDPFSPNRFQ
jgi:glycine oxidase